MKHGRFWPKVLALWLVMLCAAGCSIKKFAINKLGDSLAGSGTTFAADNDPELVGQSMPFALKLMESLLAEVPNHRGLLFAASSGFTQYAYVFVQQDAEAMEDRDLARATEMRGRARNLYLRARDYALRGLDVSHRGISAGLRKDPRKAVAVTRRSDVPLMFWAALSWGAAISISKDRPDLVADQVAVEALIDRAFELDPDYDYGTIHGFLIAYESARQGVKGDSAERSRQHFAQAVALTKGQMAAPYLSLAETVSVAKQNRAEFESLLKAALAIDPDARPEWRLSNLVMQRRARWLLGRVDDLFVDAPGDKPAPLDARAEKRAALLATLYRVPLGW